MLINIEYIEMLYVFTEFTFIFRNFQILWKWSKTGLRKKKKRKLMRNEIIYLLKFNFKK